jgi:hypothetical protein
MIKSEEIIAGLQAIVNNNGLVATLWHIAIYGLIISLMLNWNPSNKLMVILFCFPVVSVSFLAWLSGNPFNGTLFAVLAVLIIIFGLKASPQPITLSQITFLVIGILMIIFALSYPHFLESDSFIKYLYASPAGLIPCPTLSLLIGFALIYNGLGSNALTISLVIYGLFYGLFGVFRLGVTLDIGLIIGAISLLIKYIMSFRHIA